MSQPEESRQKTTETDQSLLRYGQRPKSRIAQTPPRPPGERGEVRVERDGELRPLKPEEMT
jgi:hypothetical protein